MLFNLEQYSLFSAFIIGLLHVLEPCEDKAIASIYVAWAGKTMKRCLFLIVLYGAGMILINTFLGFLAAFAGVHFLEEFQPFLMGGAAILTIIFGFLIIFHSHLFEAHCPIKLFKKVNPENLKSVIAFGLIRGLPLCPIEAGIMLWAASIGDIFYGTLLVFVFSLGTVISLIPFALGVKGILAILENRLGQRITKLMPIFVGMIIILIGVVLLLEL
jgi:cytochrome c biogenesis protein CcdA